MHDSFMRDFMYRERLRLAYAPHWKIVTHLERHETAAAFHWRTLMALSRPPYNEAPGFADDRRPTPIGPRHRRIAGHEVTYCWRRAYWRTLWRYIKHEALAGYYSALPGGGGEHHRFDTNRRNHAIVSGITS